MITQAFAQYPKISWQRGEYIEMGGYNAFGTSEDGREWLAVWYDYGFTIEIEYIQEA